ncbi:MAG: sigma-54-dependent Fis family transcriptional regulator [Spirochaetes bacterium]|nr:MAG: sigma-54-dependent Fis family transcriptional regulator [Spirochaetota bacterium]
MFLQSLFYLVKPVEESRLVSVIKQVAENRELKRKFENLKTAFLNRTLESPEAFSKIITRNEKMLSIFLFIETIAKTSETVLITGETGTGKELIAEALHRTSGIEGNFVAVNIAGLDDTIFADTLFGHRKGAFTSALESREGMIERASGGTIFLDEIGDLSVSSQVKLLRLLETREYYPLGSDIPKRTDARILLATNKNLEELVKKGGFRKDFYYRISTHEVHLPPLKERLDDLPLLVNHFLEEACTVLSREKPAVPRELLPLLENYDFPGNIRELRSMMFEALSRHKSGILSLATFKRKIGRETGLPGKSLEDGLVTFSDRLPTLKQVNELLIREAMKRSGGNQSLAASFLGISPQALSKRLIKDRKERK